MMPPQFIGLPSPQHQFGVWVLQLKQFAVGAQKTASRLQAAVGVWHDRTQEGRLKQVAFDLDRSPVPPENRANGQAIQPAQPFHPSLGPLYSVFELILY